MRYIPLRAPATVGTDVIFEPKLLVLVRRRCQSQPLVLAFQLLIGCEHATLAEMTSETTTNIKTQRGTSVAK